MESLTSSKPGSRKPNYNRWRDPITGKIINTRGVPAYIRNRYGLEYKHKYLKAPIIFKFDYDSKKGQEIYWKFKDIFDIIGLEGELKYEFIEVFTKWLKNFRKELLYGKVENLQYPMYVLSQLAGYDDNSEDYFANFDSQDETEKGEQLTLF